ncbi:MAG TPA: phosphatase PAP2 family protein [Xanthobacteraceae bacterium]|nr:phosphatase PAP2 family protein [Xanthobacteraceae bacterium]
MTTTSIDADCSHADKSVRVIRVEADYLQLSAILLIIAATVTAVSAAGVSLDLAFSAVFFDAARQFSGARDHYVAALRDHGFISLAVCIACVGLGVAKLLPWKTPFAIQPRISAFLVTAYVLGPGILTNAILKQHWGRPRPGAVLEFGGALPYVDWWDTAGSCLRNCSFTSGEAAAAAWLLGPAMFVPPPWRALAIGAAAAFFVFTSMLRVAMGAHFLADVVIGGLGSLLLLLALRPIFFPHRRWSLAIAWANVREKLISLVRLRQPAMP